MRRFGILSGIAVLGLTGLPGGPALAQSAPEVTVQLDFGLRYYTNDGLFDGQSEKGAHFFVGGELDASADLGPGAVRLQFSALQDERAGRSHVNLKRAYYSQRTGAVDVLVGWNVENWGVVDSDTVMNVMNPQVQTDSIGGGDLMGTPMINANFTSQYGTFSAYALTGFVEPILPTRDARHRALWPSDETAPLFQEGNGKDLDVALRYANNFALGGSAVDVAAHYFNGTSRTPKNRPFCNGPSGPVTPALCAAINASPSEDLFYATATDPALAAISAVPTVGFVPFFQKIEQVGASVVYTHDDLQLRFEGTYTMPKGETGYVSAVIGGDYTWSDLGPNGASLALALEFLRDDRNSRQPTAIFQKDVFLGAAYMLNDALDTRFEAGGFYDLDSHAQLYRLQASRRINDRVRAEFNAVLIETDGWNDPLSFAKDDSYFELKISAFF